MHCYSFNDDKLMAKGGNGIKNETQGNIKDEGDETVYQCEMICSKNKKERDAEHMKRPW